MTPFSYIVTYKKKVRLRDLDKTGTRVYVGICTIITLLEISFIIEILTK